MKAAVLKEDNMVEARVAAVPALVPRFVKLGLSMMVESGAGEASGHLDDAYREAGAAIVESRDRLFEEADILLTVRLFASRVVAEGAAAEDLSRLRQGQLLIGMLDPLGAPKAIEQLAATGVLAYAMELIPRISRAQSMDALSSMATIAGYRAVILAAARLPRLFPMMMTAAGTLSPARVFVIGAGVAGLQAIATARRLGGVVEAYDVRPAVKEQVQSLGAKFVDLPIESAGSEDQGGYAKAQDDSFYRRQRELMAEVVARSDVVITTAAIPGKRSPVLVTSEMLEQMKPGSVVVDLAAEGGGNVEATVAGKEVRHGGVLVLGPLNVPSQIPQDASQLYAGNLVNFLGNMMKDGKHAPTDEIAEQTLVCSGGEIRSPRLRELLGIASAPIKEEG